MISPFQKLFSINKASKYDIIHLSIYSSIYLKRQTVHRTTLFFLRRMLMKKNVKESEFTPEQKALYDAHDTLLDEFKRRKAQRQKIGALIRKKAWSLRGLLANAKCKSGESDLTLKARSMDLQKHKKQAKKEKRRLSSYGQVTDTNRI